MTGDVNLRRHNNRVEPLADAEAGNSGFDNCRRLDIICIRMNFRFADRQDHVTTGEYGSQMLSLGGVHHLTGGSKAEGRATCDALLNLCNRKPVELTIDGGATMGHGKARSCWGCAALSRASLPAKAPGG